MERDDRSLAARIERAAQEERPQDAELPSYLREGVLNHLSDMRGFDAVRNAQMRAGFVRNELVVPDGASNLFRRAHGGFSLALVDTAACMAAYTLGKRVVTLQCSCSFTAPVEIGEPAAVEATVIHAGGTTVVSKVEISDSRGRLCVSATVTMYVVGTVGEADGVPQPFFPRNEEVRRG